VEAAHDSDFEVRKLSVQILTSLYVNSSRSAVPAPPLPQELNRFLDLLDERIDDPIPDVRKQAKWIRDAIAPKVSQGVP
jgi:hypothetical protein